jgi:predicted nucleotidyltransferase
MNELEVNVCRLHDETPTGTHIVLYGSWVYGTNTKDSDVDLQVIVPNGYSFEPSKLINTRSVDVHVHTFDEFKDALDNHEPYAVESYFTDKVVKKGNMPKFELDKAKLRSTFSEKASNSWIKAKKKLIVPESRDEWIAKKSLFHSLRILDFGIQLATYKTIANFATMNEVLDQLRGMPADWEIINAEFKPMYNELSTEFRKVCPK